jgi:ribosome maturation factor RimP
MVPAGEPSPLPNTPLEVFSPGQTKPLMVERHLDTFAGE